MLFQKYTMFFGQRLGRGVVIRLESQQAGERAGPAQASAVLPQQTHHTRAVDQTTCSAHTTGC